jgi:hypothetical protein
VTLVTAADPALVLESLNLQLRDALAWETAADAGAWRATVRRRADTAPAGAIDALIRDHHRLDELFAVALRRVNANDLEAARPLVAEFATGLRRHLDVENELLARELPGVAAPDGTDHVAVMRREHDEILAQLAEVESALGADAPEAWEVEPFVAILSGTLAKHEYREEANLFPHWQAALARLGPERRDALLAAVQSALAGG